MDTFHAVKETVRPKLNTLKRTKKDVGRNCIKNHYYQTINGKLNLNKLTSSFNNYETKTETYNLNNFLSQIQQLNPYTVLLE